MTTLVVDIMESRPIAARYDDRYLHVTLADGREVSTALWWYRRLMKAAPKQRQLVEFMPMGVHWPEIDEDISIASMLRGEKAPGAVPE